MESHSLDLYACVMGVRFSLFQYLHWSSFWLSVTIYDWIPVRSSLIIYDQILFLVLWPDTYILKNPYREAGFLWAWIYPKVSSGFLRVIDSQEILIHRTAGNNRVCNHKVEKEVLRELDWLTEMQNQKKKKQYHICNLKW